MEAILHRPQIRNIKITQTTGRPLFSGQNPDVVIPKLEYALSIGCTVKEACSLAMISTAAYYRYINKYPESRDRFESLKQVTIFNARKAIADELYRGNWKLAWRYLETKCPQEFSAHFNLRSQIEKLEKENQRLRELLYQK